MTLFPIDTLKTRLQVRRPPPCTTFAVRSLLPGSYSALLTGITCRSSHRMGSEGQEASGGSTMGSLRQRRVRRLQLLYFFRLMRASNRTSQHALIRHITRRATWHRLRAGRSLPAGSGCRQKTSSRKCRRACTRRRQTVCEQFLAPGGTGAPGFIGATPVRRCFSGDAFLGCRTAHCCTGIRPGCAGRWRPY